MGQRKKRSNEKEKGNNKDADEWKEGDRNIVVQMEKKVKWIKVKAQRPGEWRLRKTKRDEVTRKIKNNFFHSKVEVERKEIKKAGNALQALLRDRKEATG